MRGMIAPRKDLPSVTSDGEPLARRIAGVEIRYATSHADERGEIVEIFNPAWGVSAESLVYVYQAMVRPGITKGWVMHKLQDDRLFLSQGTLRIGLFDARDGSPTHGLLNVFTISDKRRALVVIPRGVYHGVQNVGLVDAIFVNMPTRPYDHSDPDKYRLPLQNDLIPFDFTISKGY